MDKRVPVSTSNSARVGSGGRFHAPRRRSINSRYIDESKGTCSTRTRHGNLQPAELWVTVRNETAAQTQVNVSQAVLPGYICAETLLSCWLETGSASLLWPVGPIIAANISNIASISVNLFGETVLTLIPVNPKFQFNP